MAKVMMRCPRNWKLEFFTGLDVPRSQGLRNLGAKYAQCPHCNDPHPLRRLYFEDDKPPQEYVQTHALDVCYGFAAEIGVLIGHMGMIEHYLPELVAKLSGMTLENSRITTGLFSATPIEWTWLKS